MLQDMMLHPQEHQLSYEEMPSPLSDQILNFCESELFPEIQNSEVASSSNGCCYDEQSSYSTNLDLNKFQSTSEKNDETITTSTKAATSTTDNNSNNNDDNNNNSNNNNNSFSIIFDTQEEIENDIATSIDFTPSTNFNIPDHFLQQQDEQFDVNNLNNHHSPVTDVISGPLSHQYHQDHPPIVPLMGPPLGHLYAEESLSSIPPYMRVVTSSPSCSLLDPIMANYPSEASAIFAAAAANSALFYGSQLPNQELEFQEGNSRIFCPDTLPRIYNCSIELQAISNESQHLVSAVGCSNPLAAEVTTFEDPSYNETGRCSVKDRREKIHRYMKKRNERNFSKKIKYACRKTLADSRPRVRGRFARNDEFGEAASKANSYGNHEEETSDQDVKFNSIIYQDPNMVAASTHENNITHNGRIFNSNICHISTGPYDMCTPLYCTDGQLH
ncbi:PREDICTED: zinc finger protein HD1-like isoform X2 [Nicotiana attenuata]|uniref:zinc finger protein HD1-like isoform X2 n=1 Tax=Nicotiana attenuata TaxID=49451 RepID=UPI000905D4BF|nr:PREDICTED: zinc finger protein HD1-like isoform X2 [Nicotiana attenuata]